MRDCDCLSLLNASSPPKRTLFSLPCDRLLVTKTSGEDFKKAALHCFWQDRKRISFFLKLIPLLFVCGTSHHNNRYDHVVIERPWVSFQPEQLTIPECISCLIKLAWPCQTILPFYCCLPSILNITQNKATTTDSLSGFAVVLALISIVSRITPAVFTPEATVGSHNLE